MKYIKTSIFMLFFLLFGCASPPSNFYLLVPHGNQRASKITRKSISVGLNEIVLPKYLDKPQIVTWIASNELRINEFNRWGESLKYNIAHVIAQNITINNPIFSVTSYPLPLCHSQYKIFIDFLNFDTNRFGMSILNARWEIRGASKKNILYRGSSFYQTPVISHSYNAIVYAMNVNLNKLSSAITQALTRITRPYRINSKKRTRKNTRHHVSKKSWISATL